MVRPHRSLGFLSPEQFRMAGETGCGKAGRSATLENSQSFPLSPSHDGGDNFPRSLSVAMVPVLYSSNTVFFQEPSSLLRMFIVS